MKKYVGKEDKYKSNICSLPTITPLARQDSKEK